MATTAKSGLPSETLEAIRELGLKRIKETGVAGAGTGHMRDQNLLAIQKFVDDDPHCAWNFKGASDYDFNTVLEMISSVTGCSSDPGHRVGDGYISPEKTLAGIEGATARIKEVAERRGTFMLATGHPGSMLSFYLGVADLIRDLGGEIVTTGAEIQVAEKLYIDYVGPVAVLTNLSSLPHTHDFEQMRAILEDAGEIDMVVGDHGYAGVAIEAGIPTVTVMDTNDPALAVWKHTGADVTIIPMDDNKPLSRYLPHVETMRAFAGL